MLMATVDANSFMICGGEGPNNKKFSDGILFDATNREVIRSLDTQDLQFSCYLNRCCTTEYAAILAIVMCNQNKFKMIEISTIDYSVQVILDVN